MERPIGIRAASQEMLKGEHVVRKTGKAFAKNLILGDKVSVETKITRGE